MEWEPLFEEIRRWDTTGYVAQRMETIHRRMRVYMNTSEGELCLRREDGEGATDGPGLFTRGYAQPMKQFTQTVSST